MINVNTAFFLMDGTNLFLHRIAEGVSLHVGDLVIDEKSKKAFRVKNRIVILRESATNIHYEVEEQQVF